MRKNIYFLTILIGIFLGMTINNHFIAEAQAPWWDGSIFWAQPSPWYSSGFYTPISQSPNYNISYFRNQSYNSNAYLYFPYYGAQSYNGYYNYAPGYLQRGGNYQKANGSNTSFPLESEYPIAEYPMYYEGDQMMELLPRNPAYPPFASVFGGTGRVVLSYSDDQNILNPESPLYYLNPSSPYYGWTLPKKGRPGDGKTYSEL